MAREAGRQRRTLHATLAALTLILCLAALTGTALAQGPPELEVSLHATKERLQPGGTSQVTLIVTNPGPGEITAEIRLEADNGLSLAGDGRWSCSGGAACRTEMTLQEGQTTELAARATLEDGGETRSVHALIRWQGETGQDREVKLAQTFQPAAVAGAEHRPETSGAAPPPPTAAPLPPPPTVYVTEERVGYGKILGVAAITFVAAVALLGLGGVKIPRPDRLNWPERLSWLRALRPAGASRAEMPEGNRGMPYLLGIGAGAVYLALGGQFSGMNGLILVSYPAAAGLMSHWNRGSRVLYWLLSLMAVAVALAFVGAEGRPDPYASAIFAALAVIAGMVTWAWHRAWEAAGPGQDLERSSESQPGGKGEGQPGGETGDADPYQAGWQCEY